MVEKKEKVSKLEKMLERRVDEPLAWPVLTQEQMDEYIDTFITNKNAGVEGCTYIGFDENYQSLPHKNHFLTGEAVVMLYRMNADNPEWLHSSKDAKIDAYAVIGKAGKPETNPKSSAFWNGYLEETRATYISEWGSLFAVVIANEFRVSDEKYNITNDYALITMFTDGELLHSEFKEVQHVDSVKSFISTGA